MTNLLTSTTTYPERRHAVRDQLELLIEFAQALIESEGASTSEHYRSVCQTQSTAEWLLDLTESPWFTRLEPLAVGWIEEQRGFLEWFGGGCPSGGKRPEPDLPHAIGNGDASMDFFDEAMNGC